MASQLKIGIIGLDSSHTMQFARRMQAPDCPPIEKVDGMRAVACMRFETPFQDRKGLDERQRELETWGIRVTTSFDEAVAGCDAILLEINDPAYHLEYFRRAAGLGLPIFLDKPLADTMKTANEILAIGRKAGTRYFSASSLRFSPALEQACAAVAKPRMATVYGPLGKAPAGSSIVWYGVHAFEMLERALGTGAKRLLARRDGLGVVVVVEYADGRRGVVELTEGMWDYGGLIRSSEAARTFTVDTSTIYTDLLKKIQVFFATGATPVAIEDTTETMAMLDAAERSVASGHEVDVF